MPISEGRSACGGADRGEGTAGFCFGLNANPKEGAMPLARHLKDYLDKKGVTYDVVRHPPAESASGNAQAAHLPGDNVLKSVVVHCDDGYMLAVVPSTHRVELGTLENLIKRPVGLATEEEIRTLFTDCRQGAVPAIGEPYGLAVMVDDSVEEVDDVFFEGGDHESLIHLRGTDFRRLMDEQNAMQGHFSHHV